MQAGAVAQIARRAAAAHPGDGAWLPGPPLHLDSAPSRPPGVGYFFRPREGDPGRWLLLSYPAGPPPILETAPGCMGLLSNWTLLPAGPREWATSFVHGRKALGAPGGLQFAGPSPRGQAQVQMHCPQGEMQINLQQIPPPGLETRSLG